MIRFQADYFDGVSARAISVEVEADSKEIAFVERGIRCVFPLADVWVQPPLGHTRRVIELPDGGRLETGDIAILDGLRPTRGDSSFWRWLHRLENHLGWVLAALVLTVLVGWGALRYGVPALAEQVAQATPAAMEHKLGEQVLAGMDHGKYGYFKPSQLSSSRRVALSAELKALCTRQADCPSYRLEFRRGGVIGANAFALPGGIVLVTDELVALAQNDSEVMAVLAHELGHVRMRHALRQTLQGALSGLLLAAVTGDVNSLASGLPAVLLQLRYSRDFETQADAYALSALQHACVPPHVFADILGRLEKRAGASIPEVVSSHPDSKARVQPFLEATTNCGNAPVAADTR